MPDPPPTEADESTPPAWSVYLVRRGDGALYTGIATDVERRFAEHCEGRGAKALRGRGPLRLTAFTVAGDRSAAQRAESRIKRLPKAKKELLSRSRDKLTLFVKATLEEDTEGRAN